MKKIYVATLLTALTILPAAFAIGVILDNNMKSNSRLSEATSATHLEIENSRENVDY